MPKNRKAAVSTQKPIEQYEHKDKQRVNNPPVGLVDSKTDNGGGPKKKKYEYDPHLDPQLQWAGKAEHTSFEVPTVSLHVHERIDPRRIIEQVRRVSSPHVSKGSSPIPTQPSLFETEKKPLREAIEFYKHKENWSNRLIAGDSLLVMNSLLEKEGMGGKVQMVYFDPPYGIKYGSNFQPFVNKRDVKDGKDEDLTAEPEMIKAFCDTWELGIHSHLTYLRDRLLLAKELLSESGSIFVQISDENVHHIREMMDEVFGVGNFTGLVAFAKTSSFTSQVLSSAYDYLVWYAKDSSKVKYRGLLQAKKERTEGGTYTWIELENGNCRRLTAEEIRGNIELPKGKRFRADTIVSPGVTSTGAKPITFGGKEYLPSPNSHWKTTWDGMNVLAQKNRVISLGTILAYKRYEDDFPFMPFSNVWSDTIIGTFSEKLYVVQTSPITIQRCILMTTDPGDLVLDITCGSGTTAYVAENWGRRWITCDTSRVATALAKQRLMTADFDYFDLAHPDEGVGSGFRYKTVPHITLKSIANNEPAPQETLYDQPFIDNKKQRVTGPFTVEAVPALSVRSPHVSEGSSQPSGALTDVRATDTDADVSIARSGETLRQSEWIDRLRLGGVRGKGGGKIEFTRVEPLGGTHSARR